MKTLALGLVLCSGCLVVPKAKTTTRDLGTESGETIRGELTSVAVDSKQVDGAIAIQATAHHACSRPIYRVTEIKREKSARYSGVRDPRAGILAAPLAVITIPISALVTGLAVLADGDGSTSRSTTLMRTDTLPCTAPAARVAVALHWPSGATQIATTDADGAASAPIPETEPYAGVIAVAGPGAIGGDVRYQRDVPAMVAVREAVSACAARHAAIGASRVELDIDPVGRARVALDPIDEPLATCIRAGVAHARFGSRHRNAKLVLPFPAAAPGTPR